ncbi:hypothetical protein [Aestuariicoccus sp. MJ-SS9]|uniref:hypothetical protein n=1 Tax=Aestuariicoccus sp. MJ-SS9 TaxID=3079855 RepID=UPI0029085FB7|nr:hypothetical protein [Aestuariicoccus sp. MJ-SS9]MDU8913243.1 hypothetical protein [Aestuariicoccus sp. MJ-SS9]
MLRIICAATLLVLAGCGDTLGERALLGAGAGATGAAVLRGDPLTGAAVGAAANIAYCHRYPARC